jgi:hypothetical protein
MNHVLFCVFLFELFGSLFLKRTVQSNTLNHHGFQRQLKISLYFNRTLASMGVCVLL